jgi:hypothetical protein
MTRVRSKNMGPELVVRRLVFALGYRYRLHARESIEQQGWGGIMADDTKNVFISHIHEDNDGLGKLKDLVSKAGLTIRDSSINSTNLNNANDSAYIKTQVLAPQIRWASTLLVYVTPKLKTANA